MDFAWWNALQDTRLRGNRYASLCRFASHDSVVAWRRDSTDLAGFSGNVQTLCAWLRDALVAHIPGSKRYPDRSNGRSWSEPGCVPTTLWKVRPRNSNPWRSVCRPAAFRWSAMSLSARSSAPGAASGCRGPSSWRTRSWRRCSSTRESSCGRLTSATCCLPPSTGGVYSSAT